MAGAESGRHLINRRRAATKAERPPQVRIGMVTLPDLTERARRRDVAVRGIPPDDRPSAELRCAFHVTHAGGTSHEHPSTAGQARVPLSVH